MLKTNVRHWHVSLTLEDNEFDSWLRQTDILGVPSPPLPLSPPTQNCRRGRHTCNTNIIQVNTCKTNIVYVNTCKTNIVYVNTCKTNIVYVNTCKTNIVYVNTCKTNIVHVNSCKTIIMQVNTYNRFNRHSYWLYIPHIHLFIYSEILVWNYFIEYFIKGIWHKFSNLGYFIWQGTNLTYMSIFVIFKILKQKTIAMCFNHVQAHLFKIGWSLLPQ